MRTKLLTFPGKLITRLEEGLLCLLLFSMIVLSCTQIILRFFSGGFIWAEPLLRYFVLWSGLLGAAVATRHGEHIAIDIASHLLPKKAMPWLHLVINLFSAAVCSILTYVSVLFVLDEKQFGGTSIVLPLDSWQFFLIFPLAFFLISSRFLNRARLDAMAIYSILTGSRSAP